MDGRYMLPSGDHPRTLERRRADWHRPCARTTRRHVEEVKQEGLACQGEGVLHDSGSVWVFVQQSPWRRLLRPPPPAPQSPGPILPPSTLGPPASLLSPSPDFLPPAEGAQPDRRSQICRGAGPSSHCSAPPEGRDLSAGPAFLR